MQLVSDKTVRQSSLVKFSRTVSEVMERQMRHLIIMLLFVLLTCLGTNAQTQKVSIFESAEETRRQIKAGFDVNTRYEYNSTPLIYASMLGLEDIVQVLIDANAQVNLVDDSESTALHEAARNTDLDIVKMLVNAGAIVDKKNIYDRTPLHVATVYGRVAVVEYLVSKGADVNAVDFRGSSVLHRARSRIKLARNREKIEKLLIKHGAVDVSNSTLRDVPLEELVKRKKTSTNNDDTRNQKNNGQSKN